MHKKKEFRAAHSEFFSEHRIDEYKIYECVVVGSGPGASLTACMLAEAGHEVLVLEEGLVWRREEVLPFSREEMLHKYRNGGITMAFGKPLVQYVEGFCAGGGSEINSGLYHRLPDKVCELWGSRWSVDSFDAKAIFQHAAIIEKDLSVSLLPGDAPLPSQLLKRGADAMNWSCLEVPRWQKYTAENPAGERQTMTRTYLPRAINAGAFMSADARVTHISRDGQGWKISVQKDRLKGCKQRLTVRAAALFLGAGAIQTPALFQRSRIAKRAGRFLHMHPTLKVTAVFPEEVNSLELEVPVHQIKEFSPDMSMGCSISNPHYLSANFIDAESGLNKLRNEWKRMAVYYVMIVPEGHGSVRILPGFDAPLVRVGLTGKDMGTLSVGLKRLCEALFAAGAIKLYPGVSSLGPFDSLADLRSIPAILPKRETSLMTIHLTSSSAMSEDPALGVTNSWGAVHGERNLFVCDAGLLCTAPGVNPQGPLFSVVRRNIEHWLE